MENILHFILLINLAAAAFLMLLSRNPVHSVLFLILVFLCAAAILLYLGAEFLAIMFVIVYVGAIAVLFLFVVMMLNIKLTNNNNMLIQYLPFGLLFFFLASVEAYFSLTDYLILDFNFSSLAWYNLIDPLSNTEIIGQVLYQEFILCFLLCGVLLLIAMLGAIVLTQNFSSKKTNEITTRQLSRGDSVFFLFRK